MNIIRSTIRVVYIIDKSPELTEQPAASFANFLTNTVFKNANAKQIYETYAESVQYGVL